MIAQTQTQTQTQNRIHLRTAVEADHETHDGPSGACGWFDSSHDLLSGLHVEELTMPESLASTLPLSAWLQMYGCSGVRAS